MRRAGCVVVGRVRLEKLSNFRRLVAVVAVRAADKAFACDSQTRVR